MNIYTILCATRNKFLAFFEVSPDIPAGHPGGDGVRLAAVAVVVGGPGGTGRT
jgi:hypothetical protein